MNIYETECKQYQTLNALASTGGTVIFGGTSDLRIPVCELKQSFSLNLTLFNRSVSDLTLERAAEAYDRCVAPLMPKHVLLHLGEADVQRFQRDSVGFDQAYRTLIAHIRSLDRNIAIDVISLKNPQQLPDVTDLNRHLQLLAESERCGFQDISVTRVWNPAALRETAAFLGAMGYNSPLRGALPAYDLVKILYQFDSAREPVPERKPEPRSKVGRHVRIPRLSFT